MSSSEVLVLVTGANGYIASHVVVQLLEAGFRVRATTRNPADEKKNGHLLRLVKEGQALEMAAADLMKPADWPKVMVGCTYVIHLASPFFMGPRGKKAEKGIIQPALEGTLNVLRAAAGANVKRVVLTSSIAAISGGRSDLLSKRGGPIILITEEEWADPEKCQPYLKSKYLAEVAAWKFVESHPDLELSVINPALVAGPAYAKHEATSMILPFLLLCRVVPGWPDVTTTVVDVRDVATVHVRAMTHPEAAGKRFIAYSATLKLLDIVKAMSKIFGPLGYSISTWTLPYFITWGLSLVEGHIKYLLPFTRSQEIFDNSLATELLGMTWVNPFDTYIAHCHSLIKLNLVKQTKRWKKLYN